MCTSKLTMSKEDVEKAIANAFKQQFTSLTFHGEQTLSEGDLEKVDKFTLQTPYQYKGDYPVIGSIRFSEKFNDDNGDNFERSTRFLVSGSVHVDEEDNSPKITFTSPFSVRRQ